jgi:hypothetical protein
MPSLKNLKAEKVDNRIYEFHKNSPAGELYVLFKEIIASFESASEEQTGG